MSTNLKIGRAIVGLVVLTWGYYLQWMLFNLVKATELMWFMYWIAIPLAIIVVIRASLVDDD